VDFSPWPTQSPDFNPIENVCGIVKNTIAKMPTTKSVVELQQQVEDAWDSTPLRTTQTLIDSMTRRIAAIIAAKGGNTRY